MVLPASLQQRREASFTYAAAIIKSLRIVTIRQSLSVS
jgi:hypothetical protein